MIVKIKSNFVNNKIISCIGLQILQVILKLTSINPMIDKTISLNIHEPLMTSNFTSSMTASDSRHRFKISEENWVAMATTPSTNSLMKGRRVAGDVLNCRQYSHTERTPQMRRQVSWLDLMLATVACMNLQ